MSIYPLPERQPSKTADLTHIYHPPQPQTIKLHHSMGKSTCISPALCLVCISTLAEKRDKNCLYAARNLTLTQPQEWQERQHPNDMACVH